jgi:preprotein translocase subunit SecD
VNRFRGYWSLIIIILIAALALTYTFASGNKPLLGLDLQGGVSVVLQPKGQADNDTINEAIAIIRQRVDALGVAEPEITRQGSNILIQIPGVKDKDRALALVGQTAELQFRPVLQSANPSQLAAASTTTVVDPAAASTTTVAPTASSTTTTSGSGSGQQGLGIGAGELAAGGSTTPATLGDAGDEFAQADSTTTTVAPNDSSTTTTVEGSVAGLPPDVCTTGLSADQLNPTGTAILPQCEKGVLVGVFQVGPVALKGDSLSTARATLSGQTNEWVVNPVFKGGSDGIGLFNAAAGQCFQKAQTCPTGQLAIVLDGRVISAPAIQTASFQADQIQISGTFTERTAKDLATSLKYGALPVELEQQQAQIVSATLGRDALHAGLVAGLVGLILVTLYMIAFYRILGLFSILKLAIEGALLWSLISYLGTSNGLALTLAGITGIIVSIGVSLDSNVVYYEHLKEDVHNGRSIRSATDRAFHSSFSTIVKADVASLIGAGLLWWLTVGPVRGFAFYLGLSTLLDLITSWAYMRPVVKLATRSKGLLRRPSLLGIPAESVQPTTRGRGPARPTTGATR